MAAVTTVDETYVVVRFEPAHRTVAPDVKPVPITVSVNAPLPAGIELGLRLVKTMGGSPIVNMATFDTPPLGAETTVTCAWPRETRSAAVMTAPNKCSSAKSVLRGDPFQLTTEHGPK